jgi:26S proteasome regulatory subunit N10
MLPSIQNNVFIDVIVLGEIEENEPKLRELVDAANGASSADAERNCHLVTIPAGVLPSDVLISSPILAGEGGASMAGMGGGGGGDAFDEYGGIDPNMDPELAMVLRMSMEEERARQERAAAAANEGKEESKGEGGEEGTNNASMEDMSDEDALLQQALAMSMAENQGSSEEAAANEDNAMDIADDDDDAAMQMALQMSMQTEESASEGAAASGGQFQDPAFVSNVSNVVMLCVCIISRSSTLVPTLNLLI